MSDNEKISTGPNARPRNETIAQTGPGLPNDSSRPVPATEVEVERARELLQAGKLEAGNGPADGNTGGPGNPEAVPPGTPGSGENICHTCSGTGKVEGETCPDCGGTGKITEPIGGA